MRELQDIEAALLDVDGFCRDVNFEGVTWDGVAQLVRYLEPSFEERSARDRDGNLLNEPHSKTTIASTRESGAAHLTYNRGSGIVKHLQVFICREDNGSPFVALTVFPQDVVRSQDLKHDFIEWVNEMCAHLQAKRYYCRYENASWSLGDTDTMSGVFIISN